MIRESFSHSAPLSQWGHANADDDFSSSCFTRTDLGFPSKGHCRVSQTKHSKHSSITPAWIGIDEMCWRVCLCLSTERKLNSWNAEHPVWNQFGLFPLKDNMRTIKRWIWRSLEGNLQKNTRRIFWIMSMAGFCSKCNSTSNQHMQAPELSARLMWMTSLLFVRN